MENWENLIRNVKILIDKKQNILETQTMISLVLKLFNNLNWNIFNMEYVRFEETTENKKRADIILYSNKQKIIVEVKRFQTELTSGHFEQLMNYVNTFGNCTYGILTNGNNYWIGDNSDGSKANKDKKIYEFSVENLTDFNLDILKIFEFGFKKLDKLNKIIQFQNLDKELNNKKESLILSKVKEIKEKEPELLILEKQKPKQKSKKKGKYTEIYHTKKTSEKLQKLYEKLKQNVFEFDKNIEISFRKLYISFKINNRSFLEIIFLKKSLKCVFGRKKMQLDDFKNICKDISEVGSWGTGEFQFHIKDETYFDYKLDLIKKSYSYINTLFP